MRLIDADALCKHLHELKTGDKDTVEVIRKAADDD